MFVFDAANWWTPAWLDRVLPRLEPAPGAPPPDTASEADQPPTAASPASA